MLESTPKREPKLNEYKVLAKEILSKAEKCQEKLKQDVKRGISSYLFGKHVKKPEMNEFPAPSQGKRRATMKPNKSSLSFSANSMICKPLTGPSASNEKSRRTQIVSPKAVDKPKKITVAKAIVEKLAENIIPSTGSNVKFSDIKGQKEVKKAISDNIILPLMNPELFTGIRQPSRAILLYGPPGNGKTLLAKALAGSVKRTFFNISASSLMSKFMGEGEKMMRGLFTLAEEIGPSIIFFDEIDSILSSRGENEHEASRRMKTEFLVQFDGVGTSTSNDVLIVAATNRPFDLDNAVLRRFPKKIYVGCPDSEAREAIMKNLLKDENVHISKSEMSSLIKKVRGYSSSDLTALCKEAAMMPLEDYSIDDLRYLKKDELRSIGYEDFIMAMSKVKPSYGRKAIEEFTQWEKSLGK